MSFVFLVLLVNLISISLSQPNLWPLPQVHTNGSDTITLCNKNFYFPANIQSKALNKAIDRFNDYLMNAMPILKTFDVIDMIDMPNAQPVCTGTITVQNPDETLDLDTSDNYTLSVTSSTVTIVAKTIYGAMYALTTLEQLIKYDASTAKSNIISNAPWDITDYSLFKHRGVMLDSSRNWLSIDIIKNILDGMAMNKLNVFHWHLIDAQSFPFYAQSHPELSNKGAYSDTKVYSEANITDIVNHATSLGIRVIPEFDTPGHTMAISFGDPQLMQCVGVDDNYPDMCPEPPCGYLDVQNLKAQNLIKDVYADAYALFPDKYFHVGADEVSDTCWGKNSSALYVQWITDMCNNVHSVGKRTPVLWSGAVDVSADIGQNSFDVVIQIWDSAADKLTALKNGFKVIDSIYTSYYLDCGFSSWLTGGNSWCDPYKSWTNIYNHSLTDTIPDQYLSSILGGEVCLWGESVDDYNVQPRLWPRAGAAAERWWRNKPLIGMDMLNDAYLRLAIQRDWMVHNGIVSSPLQPEFCTLYPDYCNYYRNQIMMEEQKNDVHNGMDHVKLLNQYKLSEFVEHFENEGWSDIIENWQEIDELKLKEWGFKSGHLNKWNHLVKDQRRKRRTGR